MKSQDEIITSYIEKIEQENKELKQKLKSKPSFVLFETGWWHHNGGGLVGSIVLFSAIFLFGFLVWKGINYTDTGRFYVSDPPGQTSRVKFCVYHEYDWAKDELLGCWDESEAEEAYEAAAKHREEWKKLKALNEK